MNGRRVLALAAWLVSLCACLFVVWRTPVIADLSAFMPKMPTARQQLLVDQFKDGIIARLIMVGIEGGDEAERARLSTGLARQLRQDSAFLTVQNGDAETGERDQAHFFEQRYLLSPEVRAERFTVEGLHEAIGQAVQGLSGSAGLMLKKLFLRDPTGETLAMLDMFTGDSQPAQVDGVWASKDGSRAILLLQTRSPGSDTDAQAAAIERIRGAFASLRDQRHDTRLVMSGTGVFSVSSRAVIEHEVKVLATASTVLVAGMLLLVYRSLSLLLLGLVPVVSAALAGVAAVGLWFGHVHGLTLAFGTTLVGEAVDYAIFLFMQRASGEPSVHFWRTVRLGVLTSLAGFAVLMASGFPGLAQLGVYSVAGLIVAALVTRFVLPLLLPARLAVRDLSRVNAGLDRLISAGRRLWFVPALLSVLALAWLGWHHDGIWSRQLSALNPVSKADQELDVSLRNDLGAPDMRYIASMTAPDAESALRRAEQVALVLRQAVRDGELGGFKSPAMVLPSEATQRSRQAALPEAGVLRSRLQAALEGGVVQPDRLDGFVADVERARSAPLLTRASLEGTSAAMLVDSLLIPRAHDHLVLMPLKAPGTGPHPDEIDTEALDKRLRAAGLADVTVIDILSETTSVFDSYLREALTLSGAGALAVTLLLAASLRSARRTWRVLAPLAAAVLCVMAGLVALGHELTILHVVGLLLVVAVGSNYALFFDAAMAGRPQAERLRTQGSLVLANLSTVGTYGMLGLSTIPVLSAIGGTVAVGTFLSLLFAAWMAPAPVPAPMTEPGAQA